MSLSNIIHLTSLEMGLILLVILFAAMLVLSRRPATRPEKPGQVIEFEGLKEWVKESESLCETLSKNLQEKRKIGKRLIGQLDTKIEQMNQLLEKLNEKETSPGQEVKSKDLYPVIIEMADSGCHVSQIARWLKISEGEVQLVLDLKKFGRGEDSPSQARASRV
jgi:hypothetical protein